ncbi:DUF1540 domain-containing protein [Paenibacillus sp. IHBB 10380]|uniref:DUF1540 domain-containing protein n=1 Tax=Paenibacillus sp. IHBB 10380 TaxID=1566358 RepID=UPI0005CFB4B6|nr:DUF1540 domain-containing protein [Paenibacillus sp. IHBB 10380]AJS57719.1 hypothetical protein UB51_03540 [Paenibacillus sp. IHBB 10380]
MINEPRTYVKCSVSNCNYWGEHNVCRADQIMIEIDSHAKINLKEEYGKEDFVDHKDKAQSSSSTCCLTFKPKSS